MRFACPFAPVSASPMVRASAYDSRLRAPAMRSANAAAPSVRRNVSGSWPAGSRATFTRRAPALSNDPDRFTAHAKPPAPGSSRSSARSAAFRPAASASKKVTTSSQ